MCTIYPELTFFDISYRDLLLNEIKINNIYDLMEFEKHLYSKEKCGCQPLKLYLFRSLLPIAKKIYPH